MPYGYAYYKILFNNIGEAEDYVLLQLNLEFGNISGLNSCNNNIGKRVSEIFPSNKEVFNLINICGNIAINEGSKEFEKYIKKLNRWYRVFVYSPEKGLFITLFHNVTEEKRLLKDKENLINSLNDIVIEVDSNYVYTDIWTADENLLYKPREDLLNKRVDEIFNGELANSFINALNQSAATGEKVVFEYEIPLYRGGHRWFQVKIIYLRDSFDERRFVLNISDITDRKLAEEALKESESRLIAAQSLAHVGNWELDLDTKTIWASEEVFNIYGVDHTSQHLPLEVIQEIAFPEYRESLSNALIGLITKKEKYNEEFKIKNAKTGNQRFIHSKAILLVDESGNATKVIGTLQDVTERKEKEEEIIYLSYHDKLTGLYNRRFYEEEVKRLDIEKNLPISIIIGDVNGLKLVNDAFGHDKGDELLQKAAASIQSACRTDDIVARWGGDEFVILLPKTKPEEAERIVNRIKELYSNEQVNALSVSISFGWDTKRKSEVDILKVLKSAEDYMYKHKIIENKGMRSNTINTIINTLHEKNPREEQHSRRVSEICQKIGIAIGFSEIKISKLKVVGLLHDIGKIAIEEGILNKPGKLTDHERDEIKRHPDIGYRILSSSYDMLELADCIMAHHERWDGAGYPKGLKGEAIPLVARIIALADSYDAMTSERPYRKALSEEVVLAEIRNNAGTQFDPEITRIFIEKVLDKPWQLL